MRPIAVSLICLALLGLAATAVYPQVTYVDTRFTHTDVMVPMRDGVKLHTKVYSPRDHHGQLPILLLRTPYGIDNRAERGFRGYLHDLVEDGYIFVFQDIRGRYKSEGKFVMTRPARDRNDPKAIDEASDTHDTIDWLLANVKGHNGRVGMLGISYDGWLTAVAMLDPHPALKAVSPRLPPSTCFAATTFTTTAPSASVTASSTWP